MGEYRDKTMGDISPVQKAPDGTTVHYNFKDSYLFTYGTIGRLEDFLDGNFSLSKEDKFKMLDFLKEELSKDYKDYEKHIQDKQEFFSGINQKANANAKEKLSGAKKVSMFGFIGLLLAFAFSACIRVFYSIFSAYLSWHWPEICIAATYILLWFLLCMILARKFRRTEADEMITHGVLVSASFDIAIILLLGQGGRLNWLSAVPFLISIALSIAEK